MRNKVTIAVPVYGVEKCIERCARSLFEQTSNDIEYLFVDDCSLDNSIAILKRIINDYPERRKYVQIIQHNKNKGLAAARNTAVEYCKTEFIMHVDSDDYIDTQTVEKVLHKQEETNADIVSFNYVTIGANGCSSKIKMQVPPNILEWKLQIIRRDFKSVIWSMLIRTSLYKDNKVKAVEGLNVGEDYQVSPQLFFFANRIVHLEDYLYFYVKNDFSYTSSFDIIKAEQALQSVEVLRQFFADKGFKYEEAVVLGKAKMLAMYLMGCARANQKEYGQKLRIEMRKIPASQIKEIPFSYRVLYLFDNFFLLHMYSKIGHYIKKNFR